MKVLLTGVAGTGKSTLVKELNERGVLAIDLHDVPDLFFWQNKKTGERIDHAPVHSKEWFSTMDRLCDFKKLQKLLDEHDDIIVCGVAGSDEQQKLVSLFDKTILLQCSPDTVVRRMQTRTNKSGFGKTAEEQADVVEWQKEFDPTLLGYGAIPVNTEGAIGDVIDKILGIIKAN